MIFLTTSLATFMASLDLSIVNVAFPSLERSFSADSSSVLAWVITGYSIVFGALLVTGGRTGDLVGHRRLFLGGLTVFTLGSALCGVAPDVYVLIGSRVLQGAGAAGLVPAALAMLIEEYPSDKRAHIVALWSGVGALAVATGPSLGALLISAGGWRWAFVVNIPIGVTTWLVGRRYLRESKANVRTTAPDYRGVALLTVALGALVLGISEGPTWGWTSLGVIGSAVAFVGVGATFLWSTNRHPEPVLDLELFHSRTFSIATFATLLYAMGFFAMLLGNILFLTSVWHYDILRAGLAVTPSPIVVALVSGPGGRWASAWGFRPVLLVGFAIFALALASFALNVTSNPSYLLHWLPSTLLAGVGIGLTFPILGAAAVSQLNKESYGVGSAVSQTARQVGGAIGVAVLVVILAPSVGHGSLTRFQSLWEYCAAMAVVSGLACLFLRSQKSMMNPVAESS